MRPARSLCQGDCHAARALYRPRRTDGTRGRERGKKEFKKWRSQSCEKKSVLLHRSRPLARSAVLSLFHCSAARPRAVVGEFFPQRTNSPTFCCSGVFPSPSRTREGRREEKKSISAATPPSLSLSEHRQLLRGGHRGLGRSTRTDGRTDGEADVGTDGRGRTLRRRPRASPLKEREEG